ncbi:MULTISPECIES: tRNA (adenosine(37)-N6)-threonylcarbamoyltransferase complex transferase subunit TsaD [unclassified Paenibacillus]|uniref:tRNA (adenosine(37)-N6)-threonylcarbamoyltransferase complex transferase subunit TsaD n=1 Tax=unclassified Paenibacillus TaxID=185978 RepID=UPI001AE1E02A|nr:MULTISPECIES: tRNA (adenosine(37)-N6)-threonylcarbamoyltransferase complex transferase subunit TsaD [unclassified Paenibacillus]MBP1153850.1 N6-L-threonylcarbamoyladenine synthase [Paenibacillus sp. PvP091]MBP1170765.1 N6-L-threonylcarbamoyladenine synthase [Paenibacillus sp. PvR098]MBP2441793.1 N6-L-threonylcarbamoyladenine synthase [Paenibacillus sp. PvP052]
MNKDNKASHVTEADSAPVYILAVETSCDETSVAVIRDGQEILSNVVSSQVETHQRFGGVVPEVASRKHVESVTWILEEALSQAGVQPQQLAAVAVTQGPGLIGSLLVGVVAAKAFACALELPLIGVHHIAGHIYANELVHKLEYPFMALVVSGGHTELVYVESEGRFRIIGQTRDDAVGEAYDKVGRALKLPYPGGPHIDRLAHEAKEAVPLPRAWLEPDSYDFSFSGLKSAVLAVLNQASMKGQSLAPEAVAKGFQDSVIDVLVEKALRAVREYGVKQLLLAGGVAANKGLRAELEARCAKEGVPLLAPPLSLCTDNAAMIGAAAFLKYRRGQFASLDMKADPLLKLEAWSV